MTAWAHLPNAAVIASIEADVKARPQAWIIAAGKAWPTSTVGERLDARAAAQARHFSALLNADQWSALTSTWDVVQAATNDALRTLVAWPESVDMLALTPDALRTIIDTCDGDVKHQAVLLLPAVIARNTL